MVSQINSVICSRGLSLCTFNNMFLNASSRLLSWSFHTWFLCLTMFSLSSANSISLLAVASSLGGAISRLYYIPVVGSILLFDNLLILSSSGCSNMQTKDGLIFNVLRRLICASVWGNPSSTHPLTLQSLCLSLCSTRGRTIVSGTRLPLSKHLEIVYPISGFLEISFLRRVLVQMCTNPYLFAITTAWVDLPDPGGPSKITLGGLLGALLLNLILSILAKSLATSFWALSMALYS